jgi:hypothetical protein
MTQANGTLETGDNESAKLSNKALQGALYKELELQVELTVHGINVEPDDLKALNLATLNRERATIQTATDATLDLALTVPASAVNPTSLDLPYGLTVGIHIDPTSPYGLVAEDGKPVLYKFGRKSVRVTDVAFRKRTANPFRGRKTSDGVPFDHIARINPSTGLVHVSFSVECSLKDKGEECLFCHYDNRKSIVKTPKQVAEVFTAAVEEGIATSFHLTGGFIPERRELDVYIDVAEAIREATGFKTFNASISMGAPQDHGIFEKLKEASFSIIGSNMEVWDKNIRKTIVPGKENQCGGWENWVGALEDAAVVFGKGKIFSNIIGGLEPKKTILSGIEYLSSKGVVGKAGIFRPTPGSELDGHRSPETSWHLDLAHQIVAIHRKYGFTLDQLHAHHGQGGISGIIYRIQEEYFENGKIKEWRHPVLRSDKSKTPAGAQA